MEQTESRMNCTPGTGIREPIGISLETAIRRSSKFLRAAVSIAFCFFGSGYAAIAAENTGERIYEIQYTVKPLPDTGSAQIEMALAQSRRMLRELSMDIPSSGVFTEFSGDGEIVIENNELRWIPPVDGGVLRWTADLRQRRGSDTYDAWLGSDWALFRASDIIPPARSRTLKGALSKTYLRFDLPAGWSSLTQYAERGGRYRINNPERRFDRPTGWILLGKIGVRIETIAGVRVLVGGPSGQDVRRMDMLALLNWTLPHLKGVLPDFPSRLTVISASENMWRGGLSGPRSLYIHASRPLISENATSTLLHEVMHAGTRLRTETGADWIVEGLAEYYSLELLRRSRTISRKRYDIALKDLAEWGKDAKNLCSADSTGATTALAVSVFAALQSEMRRNGADPLDDLLRNLLAVKGKVTVAGLRELAAEIHGSMPNALSARNLRGCSLQ